MSLETLLQERFAAWVNTLAAYGYEREAANRIPGAGGFELRMRRSALLGAPEVIIKVSETWAIGPDPDGLGIDANGCHLVAATWQAVISQDPERRGEERLDLDRHDAYGNPLHRHPFGETNDVHTPASWPVPVGLWAYRVEQGVAAALGLALD